MPAPKKKRIHRLQITLRFNKECSAKLALRQARDVIQAEYYPPSSNDAEPDAFKVTKIRPGRRNEYGT